MVLAATLTPEELIRLFPDAEIVNVTPEFLTADPDAPFDLLYGLHPPGEWFGTLPPGFGPDSPPYIDELGRVAAVAWPYDRCHTALVEEGVCWIPEPSPADPPNAKFMVGTTITAEGVRIDTGLLGWSGHTKLAETIAEAQEFYNSPQLARAVGRILETPEAAYFVGSLLPKATYADAETFRQAALSGDWRYDPQLEAMDAVGPSVVARPGLPNREQNLRPAEDVIEELVSVFRASADGGYQQSHEWVPRSIEELAMSIKQRTVTATIGAPRACSCNQPAEAEPVQAAGDFGGDIRELRGMISDLQAAVARLTADNTDIADVTDEPLD